MPKREYKNSLGVTQFEFGGQETLYYAVCVDDCPKKGATDLKYLATEEYPAGDNRLKSWDHDTQKVMGFCFPDTEHMQKEAESVAKALYESMDK